MDLEAGTRGEGSPHLTWEFAAMPTLIGLGFGVGVCGSIFLLKSRPWRKDPPEVGLGLAAAVVAVAAVEAPEEEEEVEVDGSPWGSPFFPVL